MKRIKTLRLTIILFVFSIMVLSIFLGFAILYALSMAGVNTGYNSIHLSFFANIFIISVVIGTIIAAVLSKKFFKPLQDVIEGTKIVAKGDFSYRIKQDEATDSEISQLVTSFNDMTEELSGIEMFRQDFINNFSHEFKTPISSIIGYAKELKQKDITEQEKEEYLSIIIAESERLSSLSSNILLLTKVENQKILSNKTTFRLDEQLRSSILVLQKSWESKNIEWDLDFDEITYVGDEDLLAQVWINLISNAIKFSHVNGKIAISCKLKNNHEIKVRISDDGIGMDDKTMQHAFDKFYQGDSSHSTKGNGLGLPLVKKIIELFHGSINIKSKLGSGTIVSILLPFELR